MFLGLVYLVTAKLLAGGKLLLAGSILLLALVVLSLGEGLIWLSLMILYGRGKTPTQR